MIRRLFFCAATLSVSILSAETAAAEFHVSTLATSHGSDQTSKSAGSVDANEELAVSLGLASIATSGTAYVSIEQHHPQPQRQNSHDDAVVEHISSSEAVGEASSIDFKPTPPHKPLLPHLDRWDVLLLLCTAITLFIAAGGGIGGGAVFVVLFVFVGGFTAPQAVALSNITILGGSLANFLFNSSRRHPTVDGPLIDWDLIMVMEPTTMLGALLGGYLHKLFPSWFTSCLLTALLILLTYKLFKRGIKTFNSETQQQQQQQQQHAAAGDVLEPLLLAADSEAGNYEQQYTSVVQCNKLSDGQLLNDNGNNMQNNNYATAWFDEENLRDQAVLQDATQQAAAAAGDGDAAGHLLTAPPQQQAVVWASQQQQQWVSNPTVGHPLSISIDPASEQWQQQQQQQDNPLAAAAAAVHDDSLKAPLLLSQYSSSSSVGGLSCLRCFSCFNPHKLRLTTIWLCERQQLPWQPILTLFFLSCWVVISDTLKVTLPCGSVGYWLVATSVILPALTVTLLVRQWLLTKTAVKEAAAAAAGWGEPDVTSGVSSIYAITGIHWTPHNSLLYPGLYSAAGVVAGLFGVGGGIVKGPLMLELGLCPEVTAATSATMIMFTAGSAAVVYINFGGVVMDYAAALLLVGFFVTLLGQLCTVRLVKALGRRSVIIFAMCLLMFLATAAASYQSAVAAAAAWDAAAAGASVWHWGSICKHR